MAIQYNVTLHNGATNNNGIITNLGYAEINNVIDFASASSWEIQVKVIGGYNDPAYVIGGTDGNCGIFIKFSDNYYRPILIDSNGNYIGGADGTRYKTSSGAEQNHTLTLKFTGTQYEFYKDGNLSATIESSTQVKSFNSPLCLGNNYNGGNFDSYVRQIDLNDCYIKVDGANAWSGVSQGYNGIHIQLRRDTLANWTSANPTLYDGEVGLITDQAKYIVGNGTSTFTSLTKHNMDTDISNLANKDLGNLSATGQAVIDGKADTSLSNITNTAKIAIAHNAMPSGAYTDLTLGASGATYTAPSDGWFTIRADGASSYTGARFVNTADGLCSGWTTGSNGSAAVHANIPAAKGQSVLLEYQDLSTVYWFRFVYAVGSESEAS